MTMQSLSTEELGSLDRLEERIQKAVQIVAKLREERDAALARAIALTEELETLRNERAQVRSRIEKLLGQLETLSSS
jgi:predicted  nucleic acid-binding Zn-ribbon protein